MITDNIQKGGGGGGSSIPLPVSIPNGGTGATTKEDARTNLGLGSLATKDSISSSEVTGLGTAATKAYTTSVTSGSSSLVTSGAVYTAISGKMDAISGTVGGSSQPVYISNGSFVAANSYPTVYSATTSYTSASTDYPAAASLVYNRFVRSIAPIQTSAYASTTLYRATKFIDSSGYLRSATSDISSGSSYSSKSVTTTLANVLEWDQITHTTKGKVGWTEISTGSFDKHLALLIWLTVTDSRGEYCEKPIFLPASVFVNITAVAPIRIVGTDDSNSIYLCNRLTTSDSVSYSRIFVYNQYSTNLIIDAWGIL